MNGFPKNDSIFSLFSSEFLDRIIKNFQKAHPIKQAVILLWIAFFFAGIFSLFHFSTEELKTFLLGIIGNGVSLESILIFWGLFILRIIVFLPMSLLLVIAPFIFENIWLGIFLSGIGQIIGASAGFFLARYYGQEFIETKNSHLMEVVNHKLENYGTLSIILLRIIPVFPYDLINFASGLSRIKFSAFLCATTLSVWPDCLLYGLLGGSLQNPKSLFFAISFGLVIFGFLWYLKGHPDFKDFFVMSIKKQFKKAKSTLKKKLTLKQIKRSKRRY